MTQELRDFLQSWLDWVEEGAPQNAPYTKKLGLCNSVARYAGEDYKLEYRISKELGKTLSAEFPDDMPYPFGMDNYAKGMNNYSQHECPTRLAWVRKQLS